jgi:hypothetical protein
MTVMMMMNRSNAVCEDGEQPKKIIAMGSHTKAASPHCNAHGLCENVHMRMDELYRKNAARSKKVSGMADGEVRSAYVGPDGRRGWRKPSRGIWRFRMRL